MPVRDVSEIVTFDGQVLEDGGSDQESLSDSAFLAQLGERVRATRARRNMSRKALAETSGVSQRYLAQLEGGAGNISIILLRRVAAALGLRLEWLLGEDDPHLSDVPHLVALYRMATAEQRRKVLGVLDPEHPDQRRARRVALIGLRGAGKSTLGAMAAERLGVPFVELNQVIEEASGMAAVEVIALYGQEGYRRLERQAVERVVALHDELVLAVAGGIVSDPETFNYLLRQFHTVWLKAAPEEHMARVRGQGDERPMAGNPAAMEELRAILTSREALYGLAEATIDTADQTPAESLATLLRTIRDRNWIHDVEAAEPDRMERVAG